MHFKILVCYCYGLIAVCHRGLSLPEVGDDQAIDGTVFTLDLPIANVIEMLPPGMFLPT